MTSRFLPTGAFLAGLAALLATAAALAQDNNGPPLPDGPGKAELLASCTGCHGVGQIIAQHLSPGGWAQEVTTMVGYGAEVTPAQQTAIVGYLSANFGTGAATPATPSGATAAPESPPTSAEPPATPGPPATATPPQGAPPPPAPSPQG